MPFTVVVSEPANEDTIAAYNYYEEKKSGLGELFLSNLQSLYLLLKEHPSANSLIAEDPHQLLRDVRLKRFPYVVVYEIQKNEVIIYAIHNTHKHPRNKLRKV
jgi:plasmid stabilization system protein ParE